ncbi:ABC transporter ATP-binding protein [Ruminococcus sp.]|uniref:ABC transporter ATP-binding protein n=1 Tax=Ruminococcus sp. TaxID=41978 RepID=UPI00386E2DC0
MKRLKNILDSETNKWIVKNAKPQVINIIIISVIYAAMAYLGVVVATLSRGIVDSAVNSDIGGIVYYAIILVSLTVGQLIIRIVSKVLNFNIQAKLEMSIKQSIFNSIIRKKYDKISQIHTGELLNRITSDVLVVVGSIISIVPNMVYFLVKLIGVFVVLFAIDKTFCFVFIIGGALMFSVVLLFKSKMKALHKAVQESDGKTRSFFQEIFSSLLVVKVFNAEKKVSENAMNLQMNNFKIKRKRNYISIVATTGFSFVFSLGYMYALIWGAFAISDHIITYGVLTSMLALVTQIQGPVRGISSILPSYYSALASAERLMDIENLENEDIVNKSLIDTKDLYSKTKKIVFDNITFSYGRENVLENTSLVLNKGDFALLAGISGIGKSTLTKLLLDVISPDSGEIYLNLSDGEKVYVDKNIRSLFSYVPQGNFLLSGTIRDNIAFVSSEPDEQKIIESAKIACAYDFISNLPNGLDTRVGENGKGLSEGQIQRIAIARAVYSDAPIIIFDEATSALDANTEVQLLKNLKKLKNKTCILISHKMAAKEICNKEIIIKDKKIISYDI